MEDAESPRTVSDVLFTRCEMPPSKFQLDNGCNLWAFLLNREPEHFESMQVLVDEPHYRGHVHCSAAFNTGVCHSFICATRSNIHLLAKSTILIQNSSRET